MNQALGWELDARDKARRLAAVEGKLAAIARLADSWAVDDDTYLHMESCQDLGYADAAVQIRAILAGGGYQ